MEGIEVTRASFVAGAVAAALLASASICASAADSIIATASEALKPLKNSPGSVATLVYDDPANPSGSFFGLFEIRFKLNAAQLFNNPKIHAYVQKSGDSWRKIAEITPPPKPASGDWVVSYVWNSRAASYEWTDTSGFDTSLKLKLVLVEDN